MAYSFMVLDSSVTPSVTGTLELLALTDIRAITYGTAVKRDDTFSLTLHLASGETFRVRYLGGSNEAFLTLWKTPVNPIPTDNPGP